MQPVLDVVAENAARLCDATRRVDSVASMVIRFGWRRSYGVSPRGLAIGRPALAADTDQLAERFLTDNDSCSRHVAERRRRSSCDVGMPWTPRRIRTMLAAPLLREGVPIGAIVIRRTEVRSVHRQADRAARNLRRPGRDRHRERAAVSRTAREVAWSNRLRRAKSWASSPAHRRIFSRCWMRSRELPRGCAMREML